MDKIKFYFELIFFSSDSLIAEIFLYQLKIIGKKIKETLPLRISQANQNSKHPVIIIYHFLLNGKILQFMINLHLLQKNSNEYQNEPSPSNYIKNLSPSNFFSSIQSQKHQSVLLLKKQRKRKLIQQRKQKHEQIQRLGSQEKIANIMSKLKLCRKEQNFQKKRLSEKNELQSHCPRKKQNQHIKINFKSAQNKQEEGEKSSQVKKQFKSKSLKNSVKIREPMIEQLKGETEKKKKSKKIITQEIIKEQRIQNKKEQYITQIQTEPIQNYSSVEGDKGI